jgi:hypothetical protein
MLSAITQFRGFIHFDYLPARLLPQPQVNRFGKCNSSEIVH